MSKPKIMSIAGTRPEAIKMAPESRPADPGADEPRLSEQLAESKV